MNLKVKSGYSRQILLSGEISEKFVEKKFKDLMNFEEEKKLVSLYIKLDFMTNLETNKDYLNNFLFKLCFKKYICIQGEHHFFDKDLDIVFEIASYPMDFLLNQIPFLKNITRIECKFDLNEFEFSSDVFSDEQIVGRALQHILEDCSPKYLDYAKYINQNGVDLKAVADKFHTIYQLNR